MSYVTKNLMSGEEVVRETHLSRIVYLPALLILVVGIAIMVEGYRGDLSSGIAMPVAGAIGVLALVVAVPAFIRRSSSVFAVTNKRVVVKVGLVRRHSTEILLRQVEGITVDQGIMGRILDFGTIVIEGTGSDRTPYRGIGAPLKFRLAVQEQIDNSLQQRDGVAPHPSGARGDSYSELLKLNELREKGALTDEEFAREKRRILGAA